MKIESTLLVLLLMVLILFQVPGYFSLPDGKSEAQKLNKFNETSAMYVTPTKPVVLLNTTVTENIALVAQNIDSKLLANHTYPFLPHRSPLIGLKIFPAQYTADR